MGDGTSFDKQNIATYTIGFKSNQSLLQRPPPTAAASIHG